MTFSYEPLPFGGSTESLGGPIDCILRTVRAEGVTGLWRGNLSTLAREVPGNMASQTDMELACRMFIYNITGD